ncbi:MAG: LacI family transcriptional regulator [Chloroflexi bacterium RBG_13_60_13]|nr:MAG: LacI family transcriptional regulator [Chloroflexi bacterium RBG_13_60_13]
MPTMRDVAKRAGASVTTVSHVVNGTRRVSDGLRQQVLTAVTELGYQPNALARSLRSKKTHTIGLVVPDSANPFFAEVARGIEDVTFEAGHSVILCNSDGNLQKELLYTDLLVEKQVDGILFVAAGFSAEHILRLLQRRIPVVVVDREIPGVSVDSVLTDNERGGWLATDHLIKLGHCRIGCITGPSDLTPSADRVRGYQRALQESGLPVESELVVKGEFQSESGHRAAHSLLGMEDPPTAVFACNDLMAVGVFGAAYERSFQVPDQLSVVGFDDIRLASFTNPPLTTVAQPKHEMGALAARMLLDRMQDPEMAPRRRLLETKLLVRRSTASVPAGRKA